MNKQDGMMPLSEFVKIKNIDTDKAVEMIRDGFYEGRKVGNDWFIASSELQNDSSEEKDNGSSLRMSARIPLAILASPGIGLLIGFVLSLGVPTFEGARSYALLYYAIFFTAIFLVVLIAIKSKRAHIMFGIVSVIGWIVVLFA